METYKAIQNLIDHATSENLNQPDDKLNKDVAEVIRSRSDMPKEAVRIFQRKIMIKNPKQLLLTFELIELCSYACELPLHNQLSTKDFLLRVGSLLNSRELEQQVKNKILQVIWVWNGLFQKDLHPLFFNFFENVRQKFQIPTGYESRYKGIQKTLNSNPQNYQAQAVYQQPQPKFQSGASSSNSNQSGQQKEKYTKLKQELDVIKQNLLLINQMIDGQDPRENVEQNEALIDLLKGLKAMEDKLRKLIEQLDDEDMMSFCLNLNDDINKTFERYNQLKNHRKPVPFYYDDMEQQQNQFLGGAQQNQQQPNDFSVFSEVAQQQQKIISQKVVSQPVSPPQQKQQPYVNPPQQQIQQPQKPQPQQTNANLMDLLDDASSQPQPQPVQNQPQIQQPKPQQQLTDLFDILSSPQQQQPQQVPVQNQPQPTQFNPNLVNQPQQPIASGQQFNQPPPQNQIPINQVNMQQPPKQNFSKYEVFDQMANPNPMMMNPMMGAQQMNPMMGSQQMNPMMNPQQMNPMMGNPQFMTYQNPNPQQMMNSQYRMPQQQNPMAFSTNVPNMGYPQQQMPMNQSLPPQYNAYNTMNMNQNSIKQPIVQQPLSYVPQQQNQEKNPFDELDDMFGINDNQKSNSQQKSQQSNNSNSLL